MARFQYSVKRFRHKITVCQRYIRKYLATNHARFEILEKQWSKMDELRIAKFNDKREHMLQNIRARFAVEMELKGGAKAQFEAKLRHIEYYGGLKKLRECRGELDASRRTYCEYFLSPEMQSVPMIAPMVKRKMLETYSKKIRARYNQECHDYVAKTKMWVELQKNQASLREVTTSLVDSVEGEKGSNYLAESFAKMLKIMPQPQPPTTMIVLPSNVMMDLVQKAVDYTQRISKKMPAAQSGGGGGQGILRTPRRQGVTSRAATTGELGRTASGGRTPGRTSSRGTVQSGVAARASSGAATPRSSNAGAGGGARKPSTANSGESDDNSDKE
eukprot:CAMPEP_0184298166 /NCGR_PEP_ID=MMETSP1049-20130417/9017_1 /TAXON_ID=77928 /ORGANISM="Proteomonas sulcata, Strain CCMP704" /LENGTH=330 /DNA_ID=CAMNT_0026608209 /DNA_START=111 /DNA_END=1103 /DNA_ORIENTATION=+